MIETILEKKKTLYLIVFANQNVLTRSIRIPYSTEQW